MRHSFLLIPLFVFASCNADQPKKNAINVLGGMRTANNNDFDEVDDPIVWGGELTIGLNRRGLGLEGGYMRAEDDDDVTIFSGSGDGEVVTNEIFAGVRNTWNTDAPWQPYIGGGVSWVDTAVDVDGSFSDDDDDIAPYARAGIGYQFNGFQVGLDARVLFATDMEFNGEESDIDYRQIVATLGWSW